ncbi:Bacteriophage tail tape measure N-terminal domain-containing protein [Methylorubrum populi]
MPANIAIRLSVEGKSETKQALDETGRSGEAAFRSVSTAADQASAATDRLTRKAQEAAAAARQAQGAAAGASGPSPSPATLREVERVRSRLDEEYRNTRQLERDVAAIGRGEAAGSFSTAYATRLRDLAERRYGTGNDNDPAGPRRGLDSNQRRDLMYQGGDVVASLGSGAGIGTVAFQQGPQILQGLAMGEGGLKGGIKALGESALSLVTPMSVGAAAVAGLGAAFLLAGKQAGDEREALEKATQGIGRATGASAAQLDVLARANAEAGKVSASTAREIVAGYASTGRIALPVIGDLTRATSEYARITGQEVPAATAELARMFADPARGAEELSGKIGALDDRTRQLIATQLEQGDKSAAQQTLADALKASIDANASATTGWAAAWNTAATAAAGYWEIMKRVAGITLGAVPEGLEEQIKGLRTRLSDRSRLMNDPQGIETEEIRSQLAAAEKQLAERGQKATRDAAEEAAKSASATAGAIAKALDPRSAQLSEFVRKRNELSAALDNPMARSRLFNEDEVVRARDAYTRAIDTMVDSNGKLRSSTELAREQDKLRLDALKATTAEQKASIAERQKAYELMGKPLTALDAGEQITRAGVLARIEEESKKGGRGKSERESKDDYDRAIRSTEDRTRRIAEQATTFGMGAEEVERFRVQQELLTAAQRAGRDVTPELTRQIEDYANKAGDAAKRNEEIRDRMRDVDDFRSVGSDGVRSLVRDLGEARSAADILNNAFDRMKQRVLDLAADSLADSLFGKRGSSGGLLESLLGGGGSAAAAAGPATGIAGFLTSVKSFLGFADGGFTGHGGRYDVAGFVHRGEVVYSQADVARHGGAAAVDAFRRSGGLSGYERGGIVGRDAFTMPSPAAMASPAAPAVQIIDQRTTAAPMPEVRRGPGGSTQIVLRDLDNALEARAQSRGKRGPGFGIG